MRHLLLLLVAFLAVAAAFSAPAAGQSYVYASDSNLGAGGSNVYPFSATPNSWRYQIFIDAKYLPANPVQFTDVAFGSTATSPTLFQASQFQVRLAHNTVGSLSATFASNFSTPPVVLFDGAMKYQAAYQKWVDLGCTSGFSYDGTSHLIVELRYRGRTSAGSTMRSDPILPRAWAKATTGDNYVATSGTATTSYGLKTRLTYIKTTLTLSGSPSPGGTVDLDLLAPPDAGKPYQVASSLGNGPIPIGSRQINLTLDDLLVITVNGYLPSVFLNYSGLLDASGKAKAQIKILNDSRLKGIRIYSAFVTLDAGAPNGISLISNTADFTIQ